MHDIQISKLWCALFRERVACTMAKNWICLALLCWGVIATLLLFIKRDCNICSESSHTKSTSSDSRSAELDDGKVAKMLNTTNSNRTINVNLSSKADVIHRGLSVAHQQAVEESMVGYKLKIFNQQDSLHEKEGFTMIMLTYKRVKVLPKLLLHYCKVKSLHKIIVIWNDIESQIPQDILDLGNQCQVTLEFIREKENKLTNRFKPRPEIKTECKFSNTYLPNLQVKGRDFNTPPFTVSVEIVIRSFEDVW